MTAAATTRSPEVTDGATPIAASLTSIAPALRAYQQIEAELNRTFLERDETIRAIMLTVLARQHAVLLGPPGTAKSDMINSLSDRIAGPSGSAQFFVYLMTKQTNEEEIFGPPDVHAFRQGIYQRVVTRKLPTAHFCFLDELFKANTAISNALLTAMNERLYDDGQGRIKIPLISLFGASNELPQGEELAAFWDRLITRLMVTYVSDSVFGQLLRTSTQARQAPSALDLTDLEALQAMVVTLPIPNTVYEAMISLREDLTGKGIIASDRRWLQMLRFVQDSALMEGRDRVEEDDLIVMKDALWSNPEQRQDIARIGSKAGQPSQRPGRRAGRPGRERLRAGDERPAGRRQRRTEDAGGDPGAHQDQEHPRPARPPARTGAGAGTQSAEDRAGAGQGQGDANAARPAGGRGLATARAGADDEHVDRNQPWP